MNRSISQFSHARRTPQQWQTLVDEWQKSGESAKRFCSARSVGYASFCQWRKRLTESDPACAQEQQAAPDSGFIDLTTLAAAPTGPWHIVLSLGNGVALTLSQR